LPFKKKKVPGLVQADYQAGKKGEKQAPELSKIV
jgi:hypothetical protein